MTIENLSLFHVVRRSSLDKNAPLLIMLHGYGSDENDLFAFASELPEELFIISLRAPYAMHPLGNAWYTIHFDAPQGKWNDKDQAIISRDKVKRFIEEACTVYPVNRQQVSLLGFSQGTIISIAVALTYPRIIKNVIGLSGYVFKDILPENLNEQDYSHLDFYCSHGTVDQVIPVEWARQSSPFFEKHGIKHFYNEFQVGHGVSPQNFYEFKTWLEQRI